MRFKGYTTVVFQHDYIYYVTALEVLTERSLPENPIVCAQTICIQMSGTIFTKVTARRSLQYVGPVTNVLLSIVI